MSYTQSVEIVEMNHCSNFTFKVIKSRIRKCSIIMVLTVLLITVYHVCVIITIKSSILYSFFNFDWRCMHKHATRSFNYCATYLSIIFIGVWGGQSCQWHSPIPNILPLKIITKLSNQIYNIYYKLWSSTVTITGEALGVESSLRFYRPMSMHALTFMSD